MAENKLADLEFDSLDDLDFGDAAANSTTQPSPPSPRVVAPPTAEELTAARPSLLKDTVQNPIDFKQHPFKRSFQDIAAGFEILEGVPASIALDIQAGKPETIIPNVGKVLRGERPAQRGDILRTLGVPEPIAATVGLISGGVGGGGKGPISNLSSITKYLPDNIAAGILAKAGSTAYKASGLKSLVQNYGKPAISRVLSILSQVPSEKVSQAIDNPNFLSKKFLESERKAVQSQYKKVIQPLIDDASKKVNLTNLDVADLGFVSGSGEATKVWESMSRVEQNKMAKWLQRLSSSDISFNQADAIKGQMDEALQQVYRKESKGIPVDYSKDFLRTTKALREKVNTLVKEQYPQAGRVFDRYADYKSGEQLRQAFEVYHPHLWQTLIGGGIGIGNRTVGAATIAGSIPKIQALGIRGGALLGESLGQSGAATPEALFELYRQNISQ